MRDTRGRDVGFVKVLRGDGSKGVETVPEGRYSGTLH